MTTKEHRISAIMLWDELRTALVNAERVIEQIIETKAWEPLGYATFADAWTARMQGLRLASDGMRVSVVYALYDSGLEDEQVVETLGPRAGITPAAVTHIRRQQTNGVPASHATARVRTHERSFPDPPRMVHIELTMAEYRQFADLAAGRGSSLKTEAEKAVKMHFMRLAREARLSV